MEINLRSGGVDSWKSPKTTTSAWDQTGRRRASVTYPISGKKFEYSHDALDRITETRLDGATDKPMVRYWYEGPGVEVTKRERGVDLSAASPNTFRTLFTDDALQRGTQIKHERQTGSASTLRVLDYTWGDGSSGRLFKRSTYYLSDASSYLSKHDLTYDKLGRLTNDKWVHVTPNGDYKHTVDAVQFYQKREKTVNMTTTTEREFTKVTDGSHQMSAYTNPATNCSCDVCGNMTAEGTTDYYYDHNNRLAHIDIDGGTDRWYRFDVFGRMVVQKAGSTEDLFYYDGLHIVEEADNALALNRLSLFGIQIDEVLYSGDTDGSGNLTAHRWPLTDHLGSVLLVLDDSAVSKTTFDYTTAYGEATIGGPETSYPYGFTGRRLIGNQLYDYRARSYAPGCGRFLQRDPNGAWGDPVSYGNPYSYCGCDPSNSNDPNGLESKCEEWKSRIDEGKRHDSFPRYNEALKRLQDKNCKVTVKCEYTCGEGNMCSAQPVFEADGSVSCKVCINPDLANTDKTLAECLAHELTHCLQYCLGSVDSSCDACLCREVQASSVSGECDQGGFDRRSNEEKDACVKRRAKGSCETSKKCKPGEATSDKLNSAYQACAGANKVGKVIPGKNYPDRRYVLLIGRLGIETTWDLRLDQGTEPRQPK